MVISFTDGFDPGIGILLSFLPFVLGFIFVTIVSVWSMHRLLKAYISKDGKKNKQPISKLPGFTLFLGCLFLLKLAVERSVFGLNLGYIDLSFLPSYSEWSSLQLGLLLLATGWLLTIYEFRKTGAQKTSDFANTESIYWVLFIVGIIMSLTTFIGILVALLGVYYLLNTTKGKPQHVASRKKSLLLITALVFCGSSLFMSFAPNNPKDPCSGIISILSDSYITNDCGEPIQENRDSYEELWDISRPVLQFLIGIGLYFYSKRQT